MVNPFAGHGEANQPAPELGHEINRFGRRHLTGNHEIALIFAALVIDQDHHATVADVFDHILDGGQKPFIPARCRLGDITFSY